MKTQIRYKKTDGSDAIALIEGPVSDIIQAKRELAAKLDLPDTDEHLDDNANLDARLRHGAIEPSSVLFDQISE
jgi:hypothetical protein